MVIQSGDPSVVAIHRQQVLGQIVGADRQKIHSTGQLSGLPGGGGYLDHHPNLGPRRRQAVLLQFLVGVF